MKIFASLGLTANAAEPPSGAKAVGVHAKRACQVVTADRTLRVPAALPGDRRIAAHRPVSRPVSTRPGDADPPAERVGGPPREQGRAVAANPTRRTERGESRGAFERRCDRA
jgi:hypothetical protein